MGRSTRLESERRNWRSGPTPLPSAMETKADGVPNCLESSCPEMGRRSDSSRLLQNSYGRNVPVGCGCLLGK